MRGLKKKVDAEGAFIARSRSPRRRSAGVKAMLKSWANKGKTVPSPFRGWPINPFHRFDFVFVREQTDTAMLLYDVLTADTANRSM